MVMKKKFKLYGDFEKVEKLEDGTVKVSGIASSETVDGAGEVVTASAMKAAIPDYMAFGAVREMHQPIAAGAAISIETGDDGITRFEALVVDEGSIKKVLCDPPVLKGFSIGGKVTSRDDLNKSIITGLKLNEISLVDRPCNPDAKLAIAKLEGAEEDEPTLGELRKAMFDVEDFANILQRIFWLASWMAQEAEYEGDNSPVPAQLRDWLVQGAAIFQAMAKEEIEELLALLPAPPTADVLAMAEKLAKGEGLEDLQKAKFSKTNKALLSEVHKALKECDTKMAALGYESEEDKGEDDSEKLAKLDGERTEALAKVEELKGELAKAMDEITTLKAQPAPPKGVKVVTKGEDITQPEETEALKKQAEEIGKLPPEQQAAALIKFIHGGR
jgi:hypothetical protein